LWLLYQGTREPPVRMPLCGFVSGHDFSRAAQEWKEMGL
jgi:hypothetical protein